MVKKIKTILITASLLTMSCQKDELTCNCDLIVKIFGQENSYTIKNVETDCNGNPTGKLNIPSDHIVKGCK